MYISDPYDSYFNGFVNLLPNIVATLNFKKLNSLPTEQVTNFVPYYIQNWNKSNIY